MTCARYLPVAAGLLLVFSEQAAADPPGATVETRVLVPSGLGTSPFNSDRSLTVPPGFEVAVWARLSAPRLLAIAPNGDVFVTQPNSGRVTVLRPSPDGSTPASFVYASGLRKPHGIAFDQQGDAQWLYVAESHRVIRYRYNAGDTSAPAAQVLVSNLPDDLIGGYGHPLKSIAIGPDHSLYVTIASSCNACPGDTTANPVRASVWRYQADGSNGSLFASGLRNAEGLAFSPGAGQLWAAVNNRDELPYPYRDASGQFGRVVRAYVDDHPPELFTAVRPGGNYGWPFCNSNPDTAAGRETMPFDNDPENNPDGRVNCAAMDRISKGIQAHSAPLGLTFLGATAFPAPWRNGAIIGYHGSWNRTVPTGYKVAYFPWNPVTQTPGAETDLVTGFYGWGRPVATGVLPDGSLLVTDDAAGAVYRMRWKPSAISAASGYPLVAPESYAAVYGSGFADGTATSAPPYPDKLGGISLTLTDSNGHVFSPPLVYVSGSQINFLVPGDASPGAARLRLNTPSGPRELGTTELRAFAPGLFTSDGSGAGDAAAVALDSKGTQLPFPVDPRSGDVFLSLYGTGIRGAANVRVLLDGEPAAVLYAGAQPTYPGLDQVNIKLPALIAGRGRVAIQVEAGGTLSNLVTIPVQ